MRFVRIRWVLALLCAAASVKLMLTALKISSIGAVGHIIGSLVAAISVLLLIAPETVFRLAEWCSKPFTAILFPSEKLSKPPLSYRLAHHYRTTGRLEESAEQYATIIEHYPDESQAYTELLEVAQKLGDAELHEKYAVQFKKRFHRDPPAAA